MTIDLRKATLISLGDNPHLKTALVLPPIKTQRPFGCGLMQFTAKTLALAAFNHDCPVMIVEHDAEPTPWHKFIVEVPEDADLLYMGWSKYRPQPREQRLEEARLKSEGLLTEDQELTKKGPVTDPVPGWPELVRVRVALSTHAILYLTRKGLEWSRQANMRCMTERKPSDVCMSETLDEVNAYGLRKPLFFQGPRGKNLNARATLIYLDENGELAS